MIKKYLFLLYIIILTFFISSCIGNTPEPQETPAPTPLPTVAVIDREPLVLASIPFENELKLLEAWQLLADYLTEQTGIPVKLDIENSYKEIIEGLASGNIDMANTGGFVYLKAHEEQGVIPLVKPISISTGEAFYKSYIIVRKDSGITHISQLKGKKFAFTDRESTSGYLVPVSMLFEAGAESLNFFSECIFAGDHDSAFLAVYNGYVEGAGISNFAFIKGKDERLKDIEVIKESDPIPTGPIVIRSDMNKEDAEKLKEAFLKIGRTEDTKELIEQLQVEGYDKASDSDYDSLRKVEKAMEKMGLEKVE